MWAGLLEKEHLTLCNPIRPLFCGFGTVEEKGFLIFLSEGLKHCTELKEDERVRRRIRFGGAGGGV